VRNDEILSLMAKGKVIIRENINELKRFWQKTFSPFLN
jgi:hypothetical protein